MRILVVEDDPVLMDGLKVGLWLTFGEGRPSIRRRVTVEGSLGDEALERLCDVVERTPVTLALKSGFAIATELDRAAGGGA